MNETPVPVDELVDEANSDGVVMIPTDSVSPNPSQPRKNFDRASLSSLADSIRAHGILQPLIVRRDGEAYQLVAGERRFRAAIIAGLRSVPCIVKDATPEDSAQIAIIENIQREDLNVFEEAEAIRSLVEKCGLTQEKVAKRLSCSQSYVANKLRLLRLTDDERKTILDASLTERHARAILRIADGAARRAATAEIIRKKMNVAATEEYVETILCSGEPFPAVEHGASREKPAGKIELEFKRRLLLRDMRIFYNSIDHAVDSVRACGFSVVSTRTRVPDGVKIEIFVKNEQKQ